MGESFEVGESLVADNEPDAVLVVGDVLLMELYDVLHADCWYQSGIIGIDVVAVTVHSQVGYVVAYITEGGVVVVDTIENRLAGGLQILFLHRHLV